jgi:hypothetical protein
MLHCLQDARTIEDKSASKGPAMSKEAQKAQAVMDFNVFLHFVCIIFHALLLAGCAHH